VLLGFDLCDRLRERVATHGRIDEATGQLKRRVAYRVRAGPCGGAAGSARGTSSAIGSARGRSVRCGQKSTRPETPPAESSVDRQRELGVTHANHARPALREGPRGARR
jgi:hypothetical protein